ncbi:MAG: outer membrane lipoprotein chaperone LolA [Deltaproteobacteria bacterium]|nr:outer membrane lipoprotein chaperone LolA [Deltaproteobacteria bacterium]
MRRCLCTIICSLFLIGAFAAHARDATILSTIQTTYQQLTDLQAEFTQETLVEALGRTVKSEGTLMLKKPGKLRIAYRGSMAREYISDGKTLWIYTPGDTQAMAYRVGDDGAISREALAFLGGFGELHQWFVVGTVRRVGQEYRVELQPKSRSGFHALDCRFGKDGLLRSMVVRNVSGGTATYAFQRIARNSGLDDAHFHFTPPKGVRVVSLPDRGK